MVDKTVRQAIFDRKDDEWSIEVKGRYACVKVQCTIYSVVQIFGLANVIKRKTLHRDTTVDKKEIEIVEHMDFL